MNSIKKQEREDEEDKSTRGNQSCNQAIKNKSMFIKVYRITT